MTEAAAPSLPFRDVPIDWEPLEDAFENNAPEVHSYLHLKTGEVLRVVDGVADPQMHARIASDGNYLRVEPVSSREQYRWMEKFIPVVVDLALRQKLAASIDGKGAFRRFKDVLMAYANERELWFQFRTERLRTFMEAWLSTNSIRAIARPQPEPESKHDLETPPESVTSLADETKRKFRSPETIRVQLRELAETLGGKDLDTLLTFGEFLKARRTARGFAQHVEHEKTDRTSALDVLRDETKLAK
ncbi:MAG: hypothetical protein KBF88_00650 [Polyangiaceae bacterium]|nr:hypothetical protein [Polyangiaceae bacterium]